MGYTRNHKVGTELMTHTCLKGHTFKSMLANAKDCPVCRKEAQQPMVFDERVNTLILRALERADGPMSEHGIWKSVNRTINILRRDVTTYMQHLEVAGKVVALADGEVDQYALKEKA